MRRQRIAVVILATGLVTIAAGCGGGGKKNSPTTTQSATTTVSKPATTTGGAEPSNGTPSFASAKNCQDLASIAAQAAAAIQASGNGATTLKTEANVLKALANAAPSDIHGDFETIAGAFSSFVQALQKSGYKLGSTTPPTAAQAAAFAKAAKAFETPRLKTAEQHLESWRKQNCKGVHVGG